MKKENDKEQDLNQIIIDNQPRLTNFIRKQVTDKNDVEDILQDVFYQLVNTINTTMNPIEQITAWLYRVTRNTIINRGKKKTEKPLSVPQSEDVDDQTIQDIAEILFDDESPSPEVEYMRSIVWIQLEEALKELPIEQREAFELTEIEGFSSKESAEIACTSVNTLLSRKHYAVNHLRIRLKDLYDELIFM